MRAQAVLLLAACAVQVKEAGAYPSYESSSPPPAPPPSPPPSPPLDYNPSRTDATDPVTDSVAGVLNDNQDQTVADVLGGAIKDKMSSDDKRKCSDLTIKENVQLEEGERYYDDNSLVYNKFMVKGTGYWADEGCSQNAFEYLIRLVMILFQDVIRGLGNKRVASIDEERVTCNGRSLRKTLNDESRHATTLANNDTNWNIPWSSTPTTGLTGDPFTMFDGKRVQFWIPAGQETKLLTCGVYELTGRVMGSGVKGDTQQWFDMFRVQVAGKEAVTVEVRGAAALLESDAGAAEGGDDVSVLPVELQQLSVREQSRRASAVTAGQALTTLRVTIDKTEVPTTGLFTTASRANVTVARDAARRIGRGYTEVLDVTAGGFAMQIHSALAGKLVGEERVKKMHLDLAFTSLNVAGCTGALPELWGLRPMSQNTARFLNPQQ